jgi:hypothetical protein
MQVASFETIIIGILVTIHSQIEKKGGILVIFVLWKRFTVWGGFNVARAEGYFLKEERI